MNEDEDLRRAFTAPGGHAPRPEECPDPETLWAAVHGELPPKDLREVVDHTATCGACAEDWRLAIEADRDEAPSAETVRPVELTAATRAARPILFPQKRARFISLAAAAAAIVLLVVGLPRLHHEDETSLKGSLHLVSQLSEGQARPRGNCLLLWSGSPGATYDVEVHTLLGQSLVQKQRITVPHYRVPESSLVGIPSGTPIEWKVTATLHGEVSHLSSTFTLR